MSAPSIAVHHLNNSRSQRILWLLEELDLPYEIKRYQRQADMMAPPELTRIHALGKSPVITDGDRVLAESGAIVQYLVETYGQGRLAPPPGTEAYWRYLYWLHYAEGSAMPNLLLKLIFDRLPAGAPGLLRPFVRGVADKVIRGFVAPRLKSHLEFQEAELAGRPWFAGPDFTAADIQMSFPLEAAVARAGLDATRPRLWDFLQRIHARPAYQRALERGGEYAFAVMKK